MKRNLTCITAFFLACALALAYCTGLVAQKSVHVPAETQKTIYLTFDDGPSNAVTPLILDILKEENIKATFFLVGQEAISRKNLVRRIAEEGHSIGIHSYTHNYREIYASPQALLDDIRKCSDCITQITGITTYLYRFPGGSFGLREELISTVKNAGLRAVDWNAACRDVEIPNADANILYQESVQTSMGRSTVILLCHDSTHRKETAKALPSIIRHFREAGYTFSALSMQKPSE